MLVGCGSGKETAAIHSSLTELERLAHTAGATVVDTVIQHRDAPDPGWMIGRGKVEELAQTVEEERIDLILFDRELSPVQLVNLERRIPCKVLDRTQLILDIFAMRARTKEGSLQVELAQLEYSLPRLPVGAGRCPAWEGDRNPRSRGKEWRRIDAISDVASGI